ncbi:CDP-glycerol glycerophosphotransferase family protein [Salinivibrio kushneri]|uniref:CDP-glycerol glycerophosphotransferase family protein n=1 Tax=Salinivibrio kushneri TaxID=1908198 RepID=A0AA47KJ09_9GAMM|nr:CDP-glycerol glycerophosphotransferase family protein [Salinivibrio kushneri]WBA07880.1 CDP-glycerol glycerophosphotransferase family protein [Salinivibrio kushneri]
MSILDVIFIKKTHRICIYTSTEKHDANLVCVEQYLKYFHNEFEVIMLTEKPSGSFLERLKSKYYLLSSYVLIIDHKIPKFLNGYGRKIFNTWHGIPLKTIRYLDSDRFNEKFLQREGRLLSGLVCSSELDRAVMSACFQIHPNKCILSGLPRNDILLGGDDLVWFKDEQELLLSKEIQGRRVISWMPTYRGTWNEGNVISPFDSENESELVETLKKYNCVLLVRSHKFSEIQELDLLRDEGLIINGDKYINTNLVLKYTDILITDYSSVWLDFSLISKKIILFTYDKDEYQNERGTIYPLDLVFQGKISTDFNSLKKEIIALLQLSSISDFQASHMFFKYIDANNTKRFVDYVLDKIK